MVLTGHECVYNNTFYKNNPLNNVDMWLIGTSNSSMVFKNNVIYADPALTPLGYISNHQGSGAYVTGDHNLWYGAGTGPHCVSDGSPCGNYVGTGDVNSSDPLLTSPSANNFSLQSGSPAKGVGVNLSGTFVDDYFTGARTAPWDFGAVAYATGGVSDAVPPASPRRVRLQ